MKSRRLAAVGLFSVIACLLLVWMCKGEEQIDKSSKETGHKFTCKYLVIQGRPSDAGGYLENAEIRMIAGRQFVTGKAFAPTSRWKPYEGKTVWIPLDCVLEMYEFDNSDDMSGL